MRRIRILLFALDKVSAMAIDRAGADWIGGDHRRVRAEARARLYDEARDMLLAEGRRSGIAEPRG